jgi:cell wall-associated NlpC family hydrolase
MLTDEIKAAIASHANDFPEQEVCGVVLRSGAVIPSENLAEDVTTGFILDDRCSDLIFRDSGGAESVVAVYHSHCLEEQPRTMVFSGLDDRSVWTYGDIAHSQRSKLPYILFHTIEQSWDYYDPDGIHPFPLIQKEDPQDISFYLGWQWMWGRADCYTLMRAYYGNVVGIELPEVERSPDPEEYLSKEWNKFQEGLLVNGFVGLEKTTRLQLHDVVLMRIRGEQWHHVGIISDSQRHHLIHHLGEPRLSERVVYGGVWVEATHQIYRHHSLCAADQNLSEGRLSR